MNQKKRHGFTLVELLVVIAIIGILMGLVLSGVHLVKQHAKKVAQINEMKNLETAWIAFLNDYRVFPPGITEMNAAAINHLTGDDDSINKRKFSYFEFTNNAAILIDGHGNTIQVVLDDNYDNQVSVPGHGQIERKVAIFTAWEDGAIGTSDDLTSWGR